MRLPCDSAYVRVKTGKPSYSPAFHGGAFLGTNALTSCFASGTARRVFTQSLPRPLTKTILAVPLDLITDPLRRVSLQLISRFGTHPLDLHTSRWHVNLLIDMFLQVGFIR